MFEYDKQDSIAQVAVECQKVYQVVNRPKMFAEFLNREKCAEFLNREEVYDDRMTLTVMTEQCEELNLTGLDVVFQY
jgi:hypothetical protein